MGVGECFELAKSKRPIGDLRESICRIAQQPAAEFWRLLIEIPARRFNFVFGLDQNVNFHADCSLACRAFKSASTSAAGRAFAEPA